MVKTMNMTDGRAAKRPRRARGSLNQRVIIEAALQISGRDGVTALTFEALGRELQAHPTAIYRHFRDKDELLLALTDELHALAQADSGLPTSDDWRADLRAWALGLHRVFLTHPQVGQLVAARTAAMEHEFAAVEHLTRCLRQAGLDDDQAARCYRVFADTVLSLASHDAALEALPAPIRRPELRSWEVEYRHLPADQYPNAAALSGLFPRLGDPANFALMVDLLIEAIAARALSSTEKGDPAGQPQI